MPPRRLTVLAALFLLAVPPIATARDPATVNHACFLALAGGEDGAHAAPEAAVDLGFADDALPASDPDIATLRAGDGFAALAARVAGNRKLAWSAFRGLAAESKPRVMGPETKRADTLDFVLGKSNTRRR